MKPYAINRIKQGELVEDNMHSMIMLGLILVLGMVLLLSGLTSATWAAKKDIKDADITRAVETEHISDAEIKKDVEHEFFWNPFVDSEDITVNVKDGEVMLTGTVRSIFEADKAVVNAFEGGAKTVRARLNLADGTEFNRYYPWDYNDIRYDY